LSCVRKIQTKLFHLLLIGSSHQLPDIFTKILGGNSFIIIVNKLEGRVLEQLNWSKPIAIGFPTNSDKLVNSFPVL